MISVIIPTLNEADNIGKCIECVKAEDADFEVIVCDGGSSDPTVQIVGSCDAMLIETEKGRGVQMNRAAEAAKGDVLLFLHADSILEEGWSGAILSALADESVAAGAFTLRIDNPALQYRLIEDWVKLRCGIFSLPYGDQGIFIRRTVFDKIGGYREMPLMEDVEILRRLKKEGRLVVLEKCAVTSGRRWVEKGWLRVWAMNRMIMLMYKFGVDPRILARLYYG